MLKWINKKRNKKGFTLVELVVVIAILGILAAIAVPRLGKSRDTAKLTTHNANVRILKSVSTMYIADHPHDEIEELTVDELGEYIDGDEFPQVPVGLENYKDSTGESIKGPYEVTVVDGNIVVTPGEYKPE